MICLQPQIYWQVLRSMMILLIKNIEAASIKKRKASFSKGLLRIKVVFAIETTYLLGCGV